MYKIGDQFKATLRVIDVVDDEFTLAVLEIDPDEGEIYISSEELDKAFNPVAKVKAAKLALLKLEQEAERLKGVIENANKQ